MLDRRDPVPLYHQVETALRHEIESGAILPASRFPTEADLIQRFGVSRSTVREALRRMEEDGLISRIAGRGTFVLPGATQSTKIERRPAKLLAYEEELTSQGGMPSVQLLSFEQWAVDNRAATLMQTNPGELVFRARQLALISGSPLWVGARYLPLRIGEEIARQAVSLVAIAAFFDSIQGIGITSCRQRLSAAGASLAQAKHLEISPGAPVLVSEYAYYDRTGSVVEAGRSFIRADRYAYVFEIPFRSDTPSIAAG